MAHVDIVINDVLSSINGGKGFAPGGSFGPQFATRIQEVDSGAEYRVARGTPRRRYELQRDALTSRDATDAWAKFLNFLMQSDGALTSFLLEDPGDFSTLPNHVTPPKAQAVDGVEPPWVPKLSPGALSGDTFQLTKTYRYHGLSPGKTRIITRPKPGSVVVFFGPVIAAEGGDYSVDYSTGIVTLLTTPTDGLSVFAECEFYVPVRFDEGLDQFLGAVSQTGEAIASLPNLAMVEVLEHQHGTEARFFGGLASRTSASSFSLSRHEEVTQMVRMTLPGLGVDLPNPNPSGVLDLEPLMTGGPYFVIYNSGSESFDVRSGVVTIATVAPGEWVQIMAQPALAGQRQWVAF